MSSRKLMTKTIVQISLDFTSIPKALETARAAVRSGVDWLEAGTPLIISEGMNSIRVLRAEFPDVPIVADLKAMDGGWLEAQMAASAGATHVVVMQRAHPETIKAMVQAAKAMAALGIKALMEPELIAAAKADLKKRVARTPYVNPLPPSVAPPLDMSVS